MVVGLVSAHQPPTTADVLAGLEATRKADQEERDRRALGGDPAKAPEACQVAAQPLARGRVDPSTTNVIRGRQIEGESA